MSAAPKASPTAGSGKRRPAALALLEPQDYVAIALARATHRHQPVDDMATDRCYLDTRLPVQRRAREAARWLTKAHEKIPELHPCVRGGAGVGGFATASDAIRDAALTERRL